jgi:hypothetical protein
MKLHKWFEMYWCTTCVQQHLDSFDLDHSIKKKPQKKNWC